MSPATPARRRSRPPSATWPGNTTPTDAASPTPTTTVEDVIPVSVPAGIDEGGAVRVPGRGTPSTHLDVAAGDLVVTVRTLPDDRFTRHGTHLQIPTLDGHTSLTIPAGTQPGTEFRLRGAGLPHPDGTGRGDLVVRVRVRIPDTPSPR